MEKTITQDDNYVNQNNSQSSIDVNSDMPFVPSMEIEEAEVKAKEVKKQKHEQDDESVELAFSNYIKDMNIYAMKNGDIHQWVGSHYKILDKNVDNQKAKEQVIALNFVKKFDATRVSEKTIKSCIAVAKMDMPLVGKNESADKIIPFKNVYLELQDDGQFLCIEPSPEYFLTYCIEATLPNVQFGKLYEPKTEFAGSLFKNYIELSMPEITKRNVLQEYIGYTLTSSVQHQVFQFWLGEGENGKSVMFKLLGAVHSNPVSTDVAAKSNFSNEHLINASLIMSPETSKGMIDENFIKGAVAGDNVYIERKNRQNVSAELSAKWIIACNDLPHVKDSSHGFWRRAQIVKWDVKVPSEKRVNELDKKIIKSEVELLDFINWALVGLSRITHNYFVYKDSEKVFTACESLVEAKKDYQERSNHLLAFVNEYELTESIDNKTFILKKDLFDVYKNFCGERGYKPNQYDNFCRELARLFPKLDTTARKRICVEIDGRTFKKPVYVLYLNSPIIDGKRNADVKNESLNERTIEVAISDEEYDKAFGKEVNDSINCKQWFV